MTVHLRLPYPSHLAVLKRWNSLLILHCHPASHMFVTDHALGLGAPLD